MMRVGQSCPPKPTLNFVQSGWNFYHRYLRCWSRDKISRFQFRPLHRDL